VQHFDFNSSVFGTKINIPVTAEVIFVSDLFVEDYVGGAELTSEALITSSPYSVFKLHSKDVTLDLLQEGHEKFWIFGNFSQLNPQLIPSIVGNMRYSVLEYDYKYCKYRSPEKHFSVEGTPCDCVNQVNGKMVSAFYYGSMGLWWMSQAQMDRYVTAFPFLAEKSNVVLSSVFSSATLDTICKLRQKTSERKGWIVLGSQSWIKGLDDAERWCIDTNKSHEVVWNMSYEALLAKLATVEGFVYLPKGGDTCPRMVIEAKLLGCKLHLNDNVQHKDEPWFATNDIDSIQDYLTQAPGIFWGGIKGMIEHRPTISGYVTVYNAVKQQYPFVQCIKSMLEFCDEVCVVDGGSTDGTLDNLVFIAYPGTHGVSEDICLVEDIRCMLELTKAVGEKSYELPDTFGKWRRDPRIRVKIIPRDWTSKRHPVFDGMQKAEARAMCTKEFCWQMDADEVVHEDDAIKIANLCRSIPNNVDVLSLPFVEYWGGPEKVRIDIQPHKWRLSRNKPHITHGIPIELRCTDVDGNTYALPGTDGCDMVDVSSGERIPHANFYTTDVENARQAALGGNEQARLAYEQWFNQVVSNLPGVFHYSWYDLPRKIKLYRDYWTRHWVQLYGQEYVDTADQNMMFGIPWAQVTDEMIGQRAAQMKQLLGGWIWHRAWDGVQTTPHITCNRTQPKVMLS
jgi:glycosyltransferase involved in cell wall biosynthesis